MRLSFSTINKHEAKKRLDSSSFGFLNKAAKDYVLNNLGDLRVQDPSMYPNPQIEAHGPKAKEHYDEIMRLMADGGSDDEC